MFRAGCMLTKTCTQNFPLKLEFTEVSEECVQTMDTYFSRVKVTQLFFKCKAGDLSPPCHHRKGLRMCCAESGLTKVALGQLSHRFLQTNRKVVSYIQDNCRQNL